MLKGGTVRGRYLRLVGHDVVLGENGGSSLYKKKSTWWLNLRSDVLTL